MFIISDVGNYGIEYNMRGISIPTSPDMGAMERARYYAEMLASDVGAIL